MKMYASSSSKPSYDVGPRGPDGSFSNRQLKKLLGRTKPLPGGGGLGPAARKEDPPGQTPHAAAGRWSHGSGGAVAVMDRPPAEGTPPAAVEQHANNIVPLPQRSSLSWLAHAPRALVLDCAYRPVNVVTWYKAFHYEYFGKAEVLEHYPPPAVCVTGQGEHPLPAVLRVAQYTADMAELCSRVVCSRRNIMVRDAFTCQYCSSKRDLTIDHVQPSSKGGVDSWANLVTACMRCNQKKGDRTLRELGWKLRKVPKEPSPYEIGIVAGISNHDILHPPEQWMDYIAPYRAKLEEHRAAAQEAGMPGLMDD